MACLHGDFEADVEVARFAEAEDVPATGYSASVRVRCTGCGEPFVWVGLHVGLSPLMPMSSVDGRELRAPLRPMSAPAGFGEEGPSFSVRVPS